MLHLECPSSCADGAISTSRSQTFYRSKANADGYDGRCKACDAVQCAERRRKKARVEVCKACLSLMDSEGWWHMR